MLESPQQEEASAPRRMGRTLAIILISMIVAVGLFMLYSHLPRANGTDTASDFITPTPVLTHPLGTLTLNRSVEYSGLHITIMQVQEAATFSDDSKRNGPYVVRLYVKVVNSGQNAIGTNYFAVVHLLLPTGQAIGPQDVAIPPASLPNNTLEGFFDFPVMSQVDLSSLVLRLGNQTMVSFK